MIPKPLHFWIAFWPFWMTFLDPYTKKGNLESTPFNQECYEGNSKWIDCDDKKIGSGWRGPPKSWRGC